MSKQRHKHLALLELWRSRGIDLVADGDSIRVVAMKGVITDADRQFLALNKPTILDHIRRDPALVRARGSRDRGGRGEGRQIHAEYAKAAEFPGVRGFCGKGGMCESPPTTR